MVGPVPGISSSLGPGEDCDGGGGGGGVIICISASQAMLMVLLWGAHLENQGLCLGRTARSQDTPWSTCLEKAKQVVMSSVSSYCPAPCRF